MSGGIDDGMTWGEEARPTAAEALAYASHKAAMSEKRYRTIKNILWAVFCVVTVLPLAFVALGAVASIVLWISHTVDNALRRVCGMPTKKLLD